MSTTALRMYTVGWSYGGIPRPKSVSLLSGLSSTRSMTREDNDDGGFGTKTMFDQLFPLWFRKMCTVLWTG